MAKRLDQQHPPGVDSAILRKSKEQNKRNWAETWGATPKIQHSVRSIHRRNSLSRNDFDLNKQNTMTFQSLVQQLYSNTVIMAIYLQAPSVSCSIQTSEVSLILSSLPTGSQARAWTGQTHRSPECRTGCQQHTPCWDVGANQGHTKIQNEHKPRI